MRRAYIKKILIEHGIRPSKRLGQSFLTSESIAERIVDSGGIHSEDQVLEIGAGLGILTERIAEKAKQVLSVEIDPRLFMILKERFLNDKRIVLLKGDILKLNLKEISQEWGGRIKVMGNLPYSITKPLLRKLLENFQSVESTVVTVQEEVARRICGNPRQSKKEYGILSLLTQYYSIPEFLFRIPTSSFYPSPEVWSAVIRLTMRNTPAIRVRDENLFFQVLKKSFSKRRKMLRNVLRESFQLEAKEIERLETTSQIGIERRGETLSLEEFGRLVDSLYEIISSRGRPECLPSSSRQ